MPNIPFGKTRLTCIFHCVRPRFPWPRAAQFAAPVLLPAAVVLFAYTSIPTFKAARAVPFEEKRLGVDVLDAVVVVGCMGTMAIFPGAVLCWCLSFGRVLVKKTQITRRSFFLMHSASSPDMFGFVATAQKFRSPWIGSNRLT